MASDLDHKNIPPKFMADPEMTQSEKNARIVEMTAKLATAERALAAQPAPAGEVPMPEPAIRAWQPATEYPDNGRTVCGYTADQLRTYGDARAAAAARECEAEMARDHHKDAIRLLAMAESAERDLRIARAAVAKVPEGVVHVPKRPTPEMVAAALYALDEEASAEAVLEEAWAAMLAAAPQPAAVNKTFTTAPNTGEVVCEAPYPSYYDCAAPQPEADPTFVIDYSKFTIAQPEAKAGADDALLSAILSAEQESAACSRCRGRGYVVDADIDDDGRSIGTMDPCPDCAAQAQPKPAEGGAVDPESPSFLSGLATGRGESEYICGLLKDPKCDRCGARNALEAETMCKPSDDSCPGVEWPLERIWQLAAPAGSGEAVAWRSKSYVPHLNGGYAWAFTTNRDDVTPDHEPLYAGAAPGQLRMFYGRLPGERTPDVCTAWGEGCSKRDGRLLHWILCSDRPPGVPGRPFDKSLLKELEDRGYDLSTLEFSIRKKAGNTAVNQPENPA